MYLVGVPKMNVIKNGNECMKRTRYTIRTL